MSFLEQLRKQAEEVKASQDADSRTADQLASETEEAMLNVFLYFNDLAKQLNILKPASNRSFPIDAANSMTQLNMEDFFVSARRKGLRNEDPWDFIQLRFKYANPEPLVVTKEAEKISRFEEFLFENGILFQVTNEVERHSNRATPAIFQIPHRVPAGVTVRGNSAVAEVTFAVRNVERFTTFALHFPAQQVTGDLLDEMAKYLLDEDSQFKRMGRYLATSP